MIRSSSGGAFPAFGAAALAMAVGLLAGCARGPEPSVSTPQPAADDPLPPPVLVTATTPLPPVSDTAPRGPIPVSPTLEGTYQARLSAASPPGRLVTLELRPDGLVVMGMDPLDGRPPLVRGGTWRPDGAERVAVELASPGAAGRDRMVFRVIPDTLRAVELDRAAYGSAGLDLVIVEHPFSAFSQSGTWRAPGGATLTLRPDRTFLLRERGTVGLGRWSVLEDRTLVLYGEGTPRRYAIQEGDGGEQLLVSGAERLAWVEEVDTFGEPFRMRGAYVYMADAGLFTECLTAKRLPVAQERASAALERAYLSARSAPGAPVLVELRGRFVMRVNSDTGRPEEVVVIDSIDRVVPRETCDGGG
jgi:hypothetical protein